MAMRSSFDCGISFRAPAAEGCSSWSRLPLQSSATMCTLWVLSTHAP